MIRDMNRLTMDEEDTLASTEIDESKSNLCTVTNP